MKVMSSVAGVALLGAGWALADSGGGEPRPYASDRISQSDIASGRVPLLEIQVRGMRAFCNPFTSKDGFGDGPTNPADSRNPGGRPTLSGNGMMLRVNGLDAQSCFECHGIVSAATMPPTQGVGGAGGVVSNAFVKPSSIDVSDADGDGTASFDGRFSNPPFVFGAGGVELLAKEMTQELQALRRRALDHPNFPVELTTSKGVSFGAIRANGQGELDTSEVQGVDNDLVVRPFGRKGEFATVRAFAVGAFAFHMGLQPTEVVGDDVDGDGDGVVDEITAGDLSALHVFAATLERPFTEKLSAKAKDGFATFEQIGCADCHVPSLETNTRRLTLSFPEVDADPSANVYIEVNLAAKPAKFRKNGVGGVTVPLFADLKRHDMGPGLAETFSLATDERNREFTTARLWGLADTAPYLHDGRATTLSEAILLHGGEAQEARDAFDALGETRRAAVITFLLSLRTPKKPASRLVRKARRKF